MELLRALAVFAEPPGPALESLSATLGFSRAPRPDEYVALFEQDLRPFASLYLGTEGGLGGDAADRVGGFWRALGSDPPDEPDHLTTVLALYAGLTHWEDEAETDRLRASFSQARAACLWEHVLSWVPVFLGRVEDLGAAPYAEWAKLLRKGLMAEAARTPMARLPLALREAPGLPADDADAGAWVEALLTPVRAGVVLTRSDLAQAADDLGLGIRAADRRAALRSVLAQAPADSAAWIAGRALSAAASAMADAVSLGAVASFWSARAAATAAAMDRAAQHVRKS